MHGDRRQHQTELEAAAFRRLVEHLRSRPDVQNIDLMNLAGFCRNCLSNWLKEAADAKGVAMSREESREAVYGMPYETWKATYQGTASPEQLAAMKRAHAGIDGWRFVCPSEDKLIANHPERMIQDSGPVIRRQLRVRSLAAMTAISFSCGRAVDDRDVP